MSEKEKKELHEKELNDVSGGVLNNVISPRVGGPGSCDPNWLKNISQPGGRVNEKKAQEALKNWKTKKN